MIGFKGCRCWGWGSIALVPAAYQALSPPLHSAVSQSRGFVFAIYLSHQKVPSRDEGRRVRNWWSAGGERWKEEEGIALA